MTISLRDRLDDLVERAPDHVEVDPHAAWRAGARRRTRRRVTVVAAVVAVVMLVGGVVAVFPRWSGPQPAGQPGTGDLTHPGRIERPWHTAPLPGDPTDAIAGWVLRGNDWTAVTPHGQLRSRDGLDPAYPAAVSPDGSRIAMVSAAEGPHILYLNNLRTATGAGSLVGVPSEDDAEVDYSVEPGQPSFWSPDSRQLAVPVVARAEGPVDAVVFGIGRRVHPLVAPRQDAELVGWTSAETVGWLSRGRLESMSFRTGEVVATVPLAVDLAGWQTASLAADGGGTLAVLNGTRLFLFEPDGELRIQAPVPHGWAEGCPLSWSGPEPWVPAARTGDGTILESVNGARILADPGLHITCSTWADAALVNPPYLGWRAWLFGQDTAWWTWWVRELGLGAVLVLSAVGVLVLRWWRRRRATRLARSEA